MHHSKTLVPGTISAFATAALSCTVIVGLGVLAAFGLYRLMSWLLSTY